MARRCSYRDEEGRCYRNGSGNPPLCRAHAIAVVAENEIGEEFPEWMQWGIEFIDRRVSQSNDPVVVNIRERLGSLLTDMAGGSVAERIASEAEARARSRYARQREAASGYAQSPPPPNPPHSPPPPPPEPESREDPRVVLGFAPDLKLTRAMVKERQRELAKYYHPDKNGNNAGMQRINEAVSRLLAEL